MGKNSDESVREGDSSSSVSPSVILATMADTTWRMFVPTVGLLLLGVWADGQFATKPWLMFIGLALGVIFAVILVKRQISETKR